MDKVYITDKQIKEAAVKLTESIETDNWQPDLIIAVTRGGLIPAGYVSYYLDNKQVACVNINSYEDEEQDTSKLEEQEYQLRVDLQNIVKKFNPKNILIIDDLIDTGVTLRFIDVNLMAVCNYFKMTGLPCNFDWKFGVLYNNEKEYMPFSKHVYSGEPKPEGWLVFPWDIRD